MFTLEQVKDAWERTYGMAAGGETASYWAAFKHELDHVDAEARERAAAGRAPTCPVSGCPSPIPVAAEVARRSYDVMGSPRTVYRPGETRYQCGAGHWHDGEREFGGPAEDVDMGVTSPAAIPGLD